MQRIGSSTATRSAFIADLHLTPEEPATVTLATRFLEEVASSCQQLFILGDLVEYWIGDDAYSGELDEFFHALERLSTPANKGPTTYLMHGNRDFLIGEKFAQSINVQLLEDDAYLLDTASGAILLMHGDTLCTDDHEYQAMRQVLRSAQWQQDFLSLSLAERHGKARQLRDQSKEATAKKSNDICDVNQHSVEQTLAEDGVSRLLHGHTHRPALHRFKHSQQTDNEFERWVVGDWHAEGAIYALLEGGDLSLRHWPGNNLFA